MNAAIKFDQGKPRPELLPADALEEVSWVLAYGATKYADHNWARGMNWSRLVGAAMRHLLAFTRGEDNDPETGRSHLAHAACCVLFLLALVLRGKGADDRWREE